MKKSLNFPRKELNFKTFKAKKIKLRLTNKFWFYKKYFRYATFLKNFYIKHKIHYYYKFNLFRYVFYFNWTKFFSKKYYDIFLEDPRIFNIHFIPNLTKYLNHLGDLQKSFFLKKKIAPGSPSQILYCLNSLILNNFFFLNYYTKSTILLYKIFSYLIWTKAVNNIF